MDLWLDQPCPPLWTHNLRNGTVRRPRTLSGSKEPGGPLAARSSIFLPWGTPPLPLPSAPCRLLVDCEPPSVNRQPPSVNHLLPLIATNLETIKTGSCPLLLRRNTRKQHKNWVPGSSQKRILATYPPFIRLRIKHASGVRRDKWFSDRIRSQANGT